MGGDARMMPHYWETIEGGFWFQRAYRELFDALPADRPSSWVEVGVFHGASLAWLGVEVVNSGKPVTIHAVDSFAGWPGVAQGDTLRVSFERNVKPLREHLNGQLVVHARPSVDVAARSLREAFDVVWLDADHSYEAVRDDIAAWWPTVKPGGVLGGDDWMFGGVRQAVYERFRASAGLIMGEREASGWPSWVVRKPC